MGLESAVEKLDKYYGRLEKGKAEKIKPSHVEKIMLKLEAKAQSLQAELGETAKETKKQRLERKLEMVREQLERARWLKETIREK
ncbi:hypothetical protein MUY35_07930 [Aliiroseovarius sp. S1339]|uniref:hypothetical protein n=1 Tax=Aliiroseovarius sp. S1339 TaxID=2936990 RepID=UPI0020BF1566|nr:hypothetical protein [Aliiroseovarius sp. S1339]MCK8463775.1 hypothetical protein [Aliiroseovarius sp. S1339]